MTGWIGHDAFDMVRYGYRQCLNLLPKSWAKVVELYDDLSGEADEASQNAHKTLTLLSQFKVLHSKLMSDECMTVKGTKKEILTPSSTFLGDVTALKTCLQKMLANNCGPPCEYVTNIACMVALAEEFAQDRNLEATLKSMFSDESPTSYRSLCNRFGDAMDECCSVTTARVVAFLLKRRWHKKDTEAPNALTDVYNDLNCVKAALAKLTEDAPSVSADAASQVDMLLKAVDESQNDSAEILEEFNTAKDEESKHVVQRVIKHGFGKRITNKLKTASAIESKVKALTQFVEDIDSAYQKQAGDLAAWMRTWARTTQGKRDQELVRFNGLFAKANAISAGGHASKGDISRKLHKMITHMQIGTMVAIGEEVKKTEVAVTIKFFAGLEELRKAVPCDCEAAISFHNTLFEDMLAVKFPKPAEMTNLTWSAKLAAVIDCTEAFGKAWAPIEAYAKAQNCAELFSMWMVCGGSLPARACQRRLARPSR